MVDSVSSTITNNAASSIAAAESYPSQPEMKMSDIANFALTAGKYAATGIGLATDAASAITGEGFATDTAALRELIDIQQQFALQMQQISMESNIQHDKHEARMAVIRNIRIG